ncbi:MAG: hypothetical protein HQM16_15065 [Deltaproteobacteria bacterium]|nr:hypothetical protein [Deltaproteobacteria bacterium]
MIFQIFFTFAMELIALVCGTALVVFAGHDKICCPRLARGMGILAMAGSLILICATGYHLKAFLDKPPVQGMRPPIVGVENTAPQGFKKPKLQMQVMEAGPVKGGIITPEKAGKGKASD